MAGSAGGTLRGIFARVAVVDGKLALRPNLGHRLGPAGLQLHRSAGVVDLEVALSVGLADPGTLGQLAARVFLIDRAECASEPPLFGQSTDAAPFFDPVIFSFDALDLRLGAGDPTATGTLMLDLKEGDRSDL
mgnify:CR=1 FL=1